jgi:hypothetical protein
MLLNSYSHRLYFFLCMNRSCRSTTTIRTIATWSSSCTLRLRWPTAFLSARPSHVLKLALNRSGLQNVLSLWRRAEVAIGAKVCLSGCLFLCLCLCLSCVCVCVCAVVYTDMRRLESGRPMLHSRSIKFSKMNMRT